MNPIPRGASRLQRATLCVLLSAFLDHSIALNATELAPTWWSVGNPPPLNISGSLPLGVANIGQAKYMAKCALEALSLQNPGIANAISAELVGAGKPIPNWNTPIAGTPEVEAQRAPLSLGQLKAIALPFYNHLNTISTARVFDQINQNHGGTSIAGTDYWQVRGNPSYTEGGYFPWNPLTSTAVNKTPATIGQLKAVFSLRFEKFSSYDSNINGIPDAWELANAGRFAVYPPVLNGSLGQNQSVAVPLFLDNQTASSVNYALSITGNTYEYVFTDTLTGSLTYVWEDIRTTGTLLPVVSNADDSIEAVDITSFNFPFYGQTYNRVYVSSNGFLTFGAASSAGTTGRQLPTTSPPEALIAALWDDLDTSTTGEIYIKQESSRLIIQYQNVGRYSGSGTYTFQVVLSANGKIQLRYNTLSGITNTITVGSQNAGGSLSLPILYNSTYLVNQMAIEIFPNEFFTIFPLVGSVAANSVSTLTTAMQSQYLPFGVYNANVTITHNGTGTNPIQVPASLSVLADTIQLTQPANYTIVPQGELMEIQATVFDSDGVNRVLFFDGATKIAEYGKRDSYTINNYLPTVGNHVLTATRIDMLGSSVQSTPVNFQVITLDTDGDGVPDALDVFPFDPTRTTAPTGTTGDVVPPQIFLSAPSNAIPSF